MKSNITPASQEPLVLDTAALMASISKNNRKSRIWAAIATVILTGTLVIGVLGIYQQNNIATKNKQHIDCIVKLLATPQKPGTTHKFISDASEQCNIKFN